MQSRLHTGAAIEFCAATARHDNKEDWKLPTVVLVHGWESHIFSSTTQREAVRRLNALGYNCLLLSLQGHEGAAGDISTVTRQDHIQDIHAAFEYLAERPEVDMSRCAAVGSSYGACLLASMASQLPSVKLLALRAPALDSSDSWNGPVQQAMAHPDLPAWRKQIHTAAECRALKGMAGYKGKSLIVWSQEDEVLPVAVLDSYVHAIGSDRGVHIIMGAPHGLSGEHREEYLDVLEEFFADNYPSR